MQYVMSNTHTYYIYMRVHIAMFINNTSLTVLFIFTQRYHTKKYKEKLKTDNTVLNIDCMHMQTMIHFLT